MDQRILALTGVPGTGKTTIGEVLAGQLVVVEAGELAEQVNAVVGSDDVREARIVDEDLLWERARDALPDGEIVVEGGLSHFCDPDLVVVLRCHPDELRARLAARDWPPPKVEENVMAEMLDAISLEVESEPAWELDTTDLAPDRAAAYIAGLFKGEDLKEPELHPLGGVDWSEELMGGYPR